MIERTTVRLPANLLRQARVRARRDGRTLTSLIETGLREVLAEDRTPKPERVLPPVSTAKGGLRPGIRLSDLQELEDIEYVERMYSLK